MKHGTNHDAVRAASAILGAAMLVMASCAADLAGTPDNSGAERIAESNRLITLGVSAQQSDRPESAADYYRRALELNPNAPVAWNNLGTVMMQQGKYLDAAAALKRAAEINPDGNDARPYENLGLVYYNAGFAEQSLQYYQMSLERDANWIPSLRGTALAARKLNKADERLADVMRRGLMVETDEKWRVVFERERLRIEGSLREKDKSRAGL